MTSLPKPITYSIYVEGLTASGLTDRGCSMGTAVLDAGEGKTVYVILDFGAMYDTSSGWMVTKHGGTDATAGSTDALVEAYARGFYECSDTSSHLYLGMGVNNSNTSGSGAGKSWGTHVNTTHNYVSANLPQVTVYGAADLEPGFGSASGARGFVDGYASNATIPLLDYGSADGCSTSGPTASCGDGWTSADVLYAAWGEYDYPFPEIYTTSGTQAKQWRCLSEREYATVGVPLTFQGMLTQHEACAQTSCSASTDNRLNADEGVAQAG